MGKYSFSEKPLSFYTGEFQIVTHFKAAANAVPGPATLMSKLMRDEIEPALGRDLLAIFRDETHFIGLDAQREIRDLRRVAHFEIQLRDDVRAQTFDIAVLDVTPIGAQMDCDPVRAGTFAKARRRHCIRFGVF